MTLSESGNIMACGMGDSSIKVFIFDPKSHDVITTNDLVINMYEQEIN